MQKLMRIYSAGRRLLSVGNRTLKQLCTIYPPQAHCALWGSFLTFSHSCRRMPPFCDKLPSAMHATVCVTRARTASPHTRLRRALQQLPLEREPRRPRATCAEYPSLPRRLRRSTILFCFSYYRRRAGACRALREQKHLRALAAP
eukprot:4593747-Pleurochrysis_carterae.AAC.1